MARSRINKSKYLLNKKSLSKRKKSMLRGGEIIRYPNGAIYDGEVLHGKIHGRGNMTYSCGTVYDGEWNDNKRNGIGNMTRVDGNIYKGHWKDDMWNGNGVLSEINGAIYDGQWKDDKREGIGKQIYSFDEVYEGDWKDDKREGIGKHIWHDGQVYEGQWKDNKREGIGKQIYSFDEVYEGQWKDNKQEGIGKYIWPDGQVYEGQLKDDKKDGIGKLTWPNGKFYEGEWSHNKRHGQGVLYFTNEQGFLKGEYINDLQEGRHTHFSCDGKIVKYYYYTHGKTFTFENDIDKYIISEQTGDTLNRYITILINLHGSDVINSICRLVHDKHVRCISPVKCGQIFINDTHSIIDAFRIAYNISHIQHNSNASTYEKIMKTIEVYNQSNTDFYDLNDGAFRRPLIDHYYQVYPVDDIFKQIYIVDTNHMIDIFRDSYDLFTQKNTELKTFDDIEQYNILSKLNPLLTINSKGLFLRSNLINVLLDLGYDTINIIDFSCRVFNTDNLTNLYTSLSNKDYVCNYIENPDENTQQGDEIVSRG